MAPSNTSETTARTPSDEENANYAESRILAAGMIVNDLYQEYVNNRTPHGEEEYRSEHWGEYRTQITSVKGLRKHMMRKWRDIIGHTPDEDDLAGRAPELCQEFALVASKLAEATQALEDVEQNYKIPTEHADDVDDMAEKANVIVEDLIDEAARVGAFASERDNENDRGRYGGDDGDGSGGDSGGGGGGGGSGGGSEAGTFSEGDFTDIDYGDLDLISVRQKQSKGHNHPLLTGPAAAVNKLKTTHTNATSANYTNEKEVKALAELLVARNFQLTTDTVNKFHDVLRNVACMNVVHIPELTMWTVLGITNLSHVLMNQGTFKLTTVMSRAVMIHRRKLDALEDKNAQRSAAGNLRYFNEMTKNWGKHDALNSDTKENALRWINESLDASNVGDKDHLDFEDLFTEPKHATAVDHIVKILNDISKRLRQMLIMLFKELKAMHAAANKGKQKKDKKTIILRETEEALLAEMEQNGDDAISLEEVPGHSYAADFFDYATKRDMSGQYYLHNFIKNMQDPLMTPINDAHIEFMLSVNNIGPGASLLDVVTNHTKACLKLMGTTGDPEGSKNLFLTNLITSLEKIKATTRWGAKGSQLVEKVRHAAYDSGRLRPQAQLGEQYDKVLRHIKMESQQTQYYGRDDGYVPPTVTTFNTTTHNNGSKKQGDTGGAAEGENRGAFLKESFEVQKDKLNQAIKMLREVKGDGVYKYYIAHSKTVLSKKYPDIVKLYNRDPNVDKIEEKDWPKFKKYLNDMSPEEYAALRVLTASVPGFMKTVASDLNKRRSKPKKGGSNTRANGTQVEDPNKPDDEPQDAQPPDDDKTKELLRRAEEAEAALVQFQNEKAAEAAATTEQKIDAITKTLELHRAALADEGIEIKFGTVGQK